jgi:inositol transport system ATP-binding protein
MDRDLPSADPPILQARHISKSFAGVQALSDVSLTVRPGEVHALMGENGAGKSTLMNVLAGLHQPDAGDILLLGPPCPDPDSPRGHAIGDRDDPPGVDAGSGSHRGGESAAGPRAGYTRDRLDPSPRAACEAQRYLDLLGIELPLNRRMRDLSVAQMQAVEIARAIGRDSRIVIMDEPTAAISDREVDALFRVIETLTRRGVAIVYITHKMEEVFRIARTVTVLRDGALVGTYAAGDLDRQRLIALMVGREISSMFPAPTATAGEPALTVRNLSRANAFRDVSFTLREGEVLGLAGLMGAGRTELVSALFGLDRPIGVKCEWGGVRCGSAPRPTPSGSGSDWSPRIAGSTGWSPPCRCGTM